VGEEGDLGVGGGEEEEGGSTLDDVDDGRLIDL
jgi:hypothetical protein